MTGLPEVAYRILIGAGSFADAQAALRLVDRIADEQVPEIGGLLVEETLVAEVADPPRQRVVTSSGTLVVAPSSKQMRTLLESDARAFRETLATLARARKWSFQRGRGELISGLCEAARGWDLLLLGYRRRRRLSGRVVLIAPPPNAPQDAARLANELATTLGTGTVALSVDGNGAESDAASRHIERVRSESALLHRLARTYASAVVLDLAAGPLRTYDQLRRLYAAAGCPVLVLGAGHGEPSLAHTIHIPPAAEPTG